MSDRTLSSLTRSFIASPGFLSHLEFCASSHFCVMGFHELMKIHVFHFLQHRIERSPTTDVEAPLGVFECGCRKIPKTVHQLRGFLLQIACRDDVVYESQSPRFRCLNQLT